MDVLRLLVAGLLLVMAVGITLRFFQVRRPALLLGSFAYGGGALLSIQLHAWWPLFAGFAAAWLFGRLGADPPTDLRFDLPTLERAAVKDVVRRQEYLEQWLSSDNQVALVDSDFVREAWSKGNRRPAYVPADNAWSLPLPTSGWLTLVSRDLMHLASLARADAVRYLDSIDALSALTLIEAGELAMEFSLPSLPPSVRSVEEAIIDSSKRERYLTAFVADAILAARLRVLAWTYQQWFGERFVQARQRSGT